MAARAAPGPPFTWHNGQRWRAILSPWQTYLDRYFSWHALTIGTTPSSDEAFDAQTWRETYQRMRELLELLHIATVVEELVWKEFFELLRGTGAAATHLIDRFMGGYSRPRRFQVDSEELELEIFPDGVPSHVESLAMCNAFLFDYDATTAPRDEFRTALSQIREMLTPAATARLADPANRLPINVHIQFKAAPATTSVDVLASCVELMQYIAAAETAAVAASTTDASSGEWTHRFPYTINQIRLTGVEHTALSTDGVAMLAKLIALGTIPVIGIVFSRISLLTAQPIGALQPLLQVMVDPDAFRRATGVNKVVASARNELVLDDWSIGTPAIDEAHRVRFVGALFSALRVSKSLTKLRFDPCNSDYTLGTRQKIMQWIAYALFSADAASSVVKLKISTESWTRENMDALMGVLAATNPADPLLRTQYAGNNRKSVMSVFLKTGTVITLKPTPLEVTSRTPPPCVVLDHDGYFRAVDNAHDLACLDIIVPYYGHCTVARTSVDHVAPSPHEARDSALVLGYRGAITSFEFSGPTSKQMLPLICFLGANLTSLTTNSFLATELLRFVLASCPNLRTFKSGETTAGNANALIDAYERGACKIETLDLDAFWLKRPGDEFVSASTAFIHVLSDPHSNVSKTLRSLVVTQMHPSAVTAVVLDAYSAMLAANRTLEYLRFPVVDHLYNPRKAALLATHKMQLPPRPLLPSQRRAFLSVVQQLSGYPPLSTTSRLDQTRANNKSNSPDLDRFGRGLVELVFAFAATPGAIRRLAICPFQRLG